MASTGPAGLAVEREFAAHLPRVVPLRTDIDAP
jgi:hypothetical protein